MRRLFCLLLAAAAACGAPGPRPVAFGEEACTHCHMTAADPRFAAELVLRTGKVLVFDDAGCLAAYLAGDELDGAEVHSLWVTDYLRPDRLIALDSAVLVRTDRVRTPMDTRVVALRPGPAADSLVTATGGTVLSWRDVVAGAGEQGTR